MARVNAGDRVLWRSKTVEIAEVSEPFAIVFEGNGGDLLQVPLSELKPLPDQDAEGFKNALTRIRKEDWARATALACSLRMLVESKANISAGAAAIARDLGVSERSVWRALRRYRESPLATALVSRGPGRRRGCRVLDVDRELVIADCIDEFYLRRERPTVSDLHEEVAAKCRAKGLKPPTRQTIALRVKSLELWETLRRREGAKAAKEACRPVPGHVEVTKPLERVEIDHTLVDVILREDTAMRAVIGRPWLTLAIDCATRMVVGFYLSFSRPSAASVAMCLAHAGLPKGSWLTEHGVAGQWPVEGRPREIWVDNAKEFDSLALRRGCEQHQISLNFRPVGAPEIGGTIERLIGTLMGHCHLLPGTTHSNVQARGDYDSEARATMTLREFTSWFTEQVVTQYHLTVHRGLGTTPLIAWQTAVAATGTPTPIANSLEFLVAFLPGDERKLTRLGVEINCQTYWSDRMRPWVGQGLKVLVTYHPARIRYVYVRLPDGSIAEAQVTRSYVPDVGVEEWRKDRLARRAAATSKDILEAKDAGRARNRQRTKEAQAAARKALRAAGAESPIVPPVDQTPDLIEPPAPNRFDFETLYL
jgi:putative transposase